MIKELKKIFTEHLSTATRKRGVCDKSNFQALEISSSGLSSLRLFSLKGLGIQESDNFRNFHFFVCFVLFEAMTEEFGLIVTQS